MRTGTAQLSGKNRQYLNLSIVLGLLHGSLSNRELSEVCNIGIKWNILARQIGWWRVFRYSHWSDVVYTITNVPYAIILLTYCTGVQLLPISRYSGYRTDVELVNLSRVWSSYHMRSYNGLVDSISPDLIQWLSISGRIKRRWWSPTSPDTFPQGPLSTLHEIRSYLDPVAEVGERPF